MTAAAAPTTAAMARLFPFLLIALHCLHEASSYSHSKLFHHRRHSLVQEQRQHFRHRHHHHHLHQHKLLLQTNSCSTTDNGYNDDGDADNIRDHATKSSNINNGVTSQQQYRRRNVLSTMTATAIAAASTAISTTCMSSFLFPNTANAAVGSLPEYSDTNAILQSITINAIDKSQFDDTIAFFTGGAFEGMKVLRERHTPVAAAAAGWQQQQQQQQYEAWLGFGPETLSIPSTFTLPVSSFSQYGGHASIHVRYDPQQQLLASSSQSSSETITPSSQPQYYQRSPGEFNNAPPTGDNIAYLQLGVPAYRISQMVKHYGNILDAYGWVNVISPCGLPVRSIVGIRPDPIMFVAVNCADVKKSEEFYYERLGFVRQEYPYARLNQGQGQFEPPQPPKSVYIGPSPNCMGILLLQNKNRKKPVVPNRTLLSLNVVYTPSNDDGGGSSSSSSDDRADRTPRLLDPSSVPISFISQDSLEKEIKRTSIVTSL
ncbi:LOW QUALITY PROTEIN: hypothetical protein ACHAXH_003978 [Discostella pseudostelligera]